MQIEAIERQTTADLVVERIAGVIKDQNLSAGERLPGEHELGEQLKVISSREAASISALRDSTVTYLQMQRQIDSGRKPAWMTKNLETIWNSVGVKVPDKATPFFKMLSGLAKAVGTKINKDTDFGAAAAAILNHSALIQVDTRATQMPDGSIMVEASRPPILLPWITSRNSSTLIDV